ncbi:hypothetical protein C8F04DRAFT_521910 [Mycena alexandri]|uniref:Diaminopimelate epimerase-like protein n=1 Tax=Mycena alexandri TaxID=1745969 RepID=A0AAD6XH26_9AGAR|nr:hypothetical protein C8F04DRAFT_521910 [Mycena alexandri]
MSRPFPFYLVAAFSKGPFQGNPAAVVFIDEDLGTDTLMKVAVNFNQPMTSVIGSPIPSTDEKVAAWNIRWFSANSHEVPLCGHGTVAAARAIFDSGLVADSVEVVEFHTQTAGVMKARKVGKDGIEIRLPSATLTEVSADENPKIAAALAKAFGRDVAVKYVGAASGGKGFESYLVVELDEQENLGKCDVNVPAFLDTGYVTNVITAAASSGEELFVSRMFAPQILPPPFSEDSVCGSAHALLAPYWSKKSGLAPDQPFSAKQVSSRGGDLGLTWDQTGGVVALTAATFVMSKGEIYL